MLVSLKVKNLALISNLEIEFGERLNILSGETGAGKSIIVDSLMLLLGGKYDKTMLKFGEESGFVEGVFSSPNVDKLLSEAGLDQDDIIIVSRKFMSDGKNEIRVNGKTFSLLMLRNFMSRLVDIYGQNEFQSLLKVTEQRRILDYCLRNELEEKLKRLSDNYYKYKLILKNMSELGDAEERARNIDLLTYQIKEIESSKVTDGEEDELVSRRKVIMASERIKDALVTALNAIEGEDNGAMNPLNEALRSVTSLSGYKDEYAVLAERVKSAIIELDDINETLRDELEKSSFDEDELENLEKRLEFVRSIKRKYGNYADMGKYLTKIKAEVDRLTNGADEYEYLQKQANDLIETLQAECAEVTKIRRDGAKRIEAEIIKQLSELGMEKSRFEVRFDETSTDFLSVLSPTGVDKFEFYLSPNPGQPLLPLAKIISGGEMSRFMLSLKIITSTLDSIETMIFDEIDTGISGVVGRSVAQKLATLSKNHQVLCVTHLPQIAAMADSHYFIDKQTVGGETATRVTLLDRNGSIEEISRLSGAKDISSSSRRNAEEMKVWSDNFKLSDKV